jgi:hypothetical protein
MNPPPIQSWLRLTCLVIVSCVGTACFSCHGLPTERLLLDAKINGKKVRLCFDSGTESFVLWRESAKRLDLKFTEAGTNRVATGLVSAGITEVCSLSLLGKEANARFNVLAAPAGGALPFDGLVGWRNIRKNILKIDAKGNRLEFLEALPKEVSKWKRIGIDTNSSTLILTFWSSQQREARFLVDTGSGAGIALPQQKWDEWSAAHILEPRTMTAFSIPSEGILAKEEAWADQFDLGPVVLSNVPISAAAQSQVIDAGKELDGALGLAALKRVDFIVDGLQGVAYVRSKTDRPSRYEHNRAGVVFIPDALGENRLVAHVVDRGPAYEAGIRNGDILEQLDGVNITNSNVSLLQKLWMPAGTKIQFSLKRDGQPTQVTVMLRDILGMNKSK